MGIAVLSVSDAIKNNPDHAKLIRGVVKQLGGYEVAKEMFEDICTHGIQGGFFGFVYYSDTVSFAKKYQKEIRALLEEQADSLGEEVPEMIKNFGYFRNNKPDKEDIKDIYLFLSGQCGRCGGHAVPNLMAWYAAEEVSRMFLPNF